MGGFIRVTIHTSHRVVANGVPGYLELLCKLGRLGIDRPIRSRVLPYNSSSSAPTLAHLVLGGSDEDYIFFLLLLGAWKVVEREVNCNDGPVKSLEPIDVQGEHV